MVPVVHYEVHLFKGDASPTEDNEKTFPVGERRGFILFLRQRQGTDHEWDRAVTVVEETGYEQVELREAKTLNSSSIYEQDEMFYECYNHTMVEGSGIIVYGPTES